MIVLFVENYAKSVLKTITQYTAKLQKRDKERDLIAGISGIFWSDPWERFTRFGTEDKNYVQVSSNYIYDSAEQFLESRCPLGSVRFFCHILELFAIMAWTRKPWF